MSALEESRAADAAPGLSPGRQLAEAREARNLSAADVARQLKLSVWQVEALESDRYDRLPGAIFVRGFIRNYARLVRLDPEELLHAAGDAVAYPSPPPERPRSREIPFPGPGKPKWPLRAGAALVIVAVLALYEIYWNREGERGTGQEPAATARASVEKPAPAAESPAEPVAAIAAGAARGPAEGAASAGSEAPGAAPAPAATAVAVGQGEPGPGEKRVQLEFEEESWVEIRDRNEKVIFSKLNPPGTEQMIDGLPPFSVVVGNAQAVRLTYDGKPVDLAPHTRIDVARLILK